NVRALPVISLTPSTSTVRRRQLTLADTSGRGLANYPVRAQFDGTGVGATTAADHILFYKGRSVPFKLIPPLNDAAVEIWFRADRRTGLNEDDIQPYYGASVENTVTADQLAAGGMDLAGSTNTSWVWNDFSISSFPTAAGVWRPGKTGQSIGGVTYGLVD